MFIRIKKNQSATVSVKVFDKNSGSYKIIKTIDGSSDHIQVRSLKLQAMEFIMNFGGRQTLSIGALTDSKFFEAVYHSIRDFRMLGPKISFWQIFEHIVFGAIPEKLFRHLVISSSYIRSVSLKRLLICINKKAASPLKLFQIEN